MKAYQLFVIVTLFNTAYLDIYAQHDYSPKLGPYSVKNRFTYKSKETIELNHHWYTPLNDQVNAYNNMGKAFPMLMTDTILVADIYDGTWEQKRGIWILFYDRERDLHNSTFDYYVLLKEMKNVDREANASEEKFLREQQEFYKTYRKPLKIQISILWFPVIGAILITFICMALKKLKVINDEMLGEMAAKFMMYGVLGGLMAGVFTAFTSFYIGAMFCLAGSIILALHSGKFGFLIILIGIACMIGLMLFHNSFKVPDWEFTF